MKVKLSQIINSQEGLKALLSIKLPVKISYALGKLVNKMQPDLKVFDEQKMKLIKELGDPAPDSPIINGEAQNWQVKPENLAKFGEELGKLLEIEIELNFNDSDPFQKIKIADLGEINIEPLQLMNLDWLLE